MQIERKKSESGQHIHETYQKYFAHFRIINYIF